MIFSNQNGSLLFPSMQKLPKSIVHHQYHLHDCKLYFKEQLVFSLPENLDCYLINDDHIILHSKDLIYVYSMDKHPKLLNTYKTSNPHIIAVNREYLACCGYLTGQIYLIHLETNQIHMLQAHTHDISYIILSKKYLATCSIQGTIIRIFDLDTREVFQEYRRGLERATILCMSFSDDDKLLSLISDKYTIHVFVLTDTKNTDFQLNFDSVDMSMHSLSVEDDDDMISVEFSNSSQYSTSAPSGSYLQKSTRRKMRGLSRFLSTLDYEYSDYSIKLPKNLISRLEANKDKLGYVQPDYGGKKTRLYCEFKTLFSNAQLVVYTFLGDIIHYGFKTQQFDSGENHSESSFQSDNSTIEEIVDITEDYGKNMIRLDWHIVHLPGIDMAMPTFEMDLEEFTFQSKTESKAEKSKHSSDDDFVFT
eukprot:NODE_576_length_5827_cov_0.654853.p2 type:complete len:420 gc:universal NODE_576_length_5827_cov_0.654853:2864-4123(+)